MNSTSSLTRPNDPILTSLSYPCDDRKCYGEKMQRVMNLHKDHLSLLAQKILDLLALPIFTFVAKSYTYILKKITWHVQYLTKLELSCFLRIVLPIISSLYASATRKIFRGKKLALKGVCKVN